MPVKHCITVTYTSRIVPEGARDTRNKLWMVQLTNKKPPTGPVSPTNMLFGSANHVTTDQWQNMREKGVILVKMGNFLEILNMCQGDRLWWILQEPAQHYSWRHIITSHLVPTPVSSVLRACLRHPDKLITFPGMSKNLINKHRPLATATCKGYMARNQINQNLTRSDRQAMLDARLQVDDMSPSEQICNIPGDEAMFVFLF